MRLVLAGGGTGGHIFPGLAVAEAVSRLRPHAEIVFLATGRPIDRQVIPAAGYRLIEQSVRPLPGVRTFWTAPAFLWHWFASKRLAAATLSGSTTGSAQSGSMTPDAGSAGLPHPNPTVVLGLGGYAAGPAIRVAASRGLPAAIINPDVCPGRANLWAERYVREIYCQWAESAAYFRDPAKVIATGCPLRASLTREGRTPSDRARAAAAFGLYPHRLTLLVTGASQGSRSINQALVALGPRLDALADTWQVLHLTGMTDHDDVAAAVGGRRILWRTVPFTTDMAAVYCLADLAIGRAGASSLAELTAVGCPAVLLPYPYHADGHQRHNAAMLVARGAAVCLDDQIVPAVNAAALAPVIEGLMTDSALRDRMAAAARQHARPDAAHTIAQRLVSLADNSPDERPTLRPYND